MIPEGNTPLFTLLIVIIEREVTEISQDRKDD